MTLSSPLTKTKFMMKTVVVAVLFAVLSACTNTKLSEVWVDPDYKSSFKHILVIGIAQSQQNRRAYESYVVADLQALGVEAIASYKLIKSDVTINRKSVKKAIEGQDIDGVIVTHLEGIDEETVYRPSMDYMPVYSGGYYGSLYSYYPHVNNYVTRPGYYTTHETYRLETNLYDVNSEELIWSAHSRSFAPESTDEVIVDLTKLIIDDLKEKKLIVSK